MKDTKQQFEHVIAICRDLFAKKLHDYGAAWRIMRPSSVTDQIFIKANRIRSIATPLVSMLRIRFALKPKGWRWWMKVSVRSLSLL